ncbi:MAG: DNA cytosine methyltransferase [Planctomycetales bacterium]|nr:DNA cytosine methyltransferase [Planctomycetales bacterium]MBN8628904.1 DNA cytosine methyltransferase [Planctomycetota bacterium]
MNSIELFAGAGGLAIGTCNAGFKHEAVLEWDADACRTLRHNMSARRTPWDIVEGDVCEFDFKRHADRVSFVFGGPPCQPFSLGGKHLGSEDRRNMFPQAVRAVREIQPKAFIFENVKGLLRQSFANYYSYIIHRFRFPDVPLRGDEDWVSHLARLEKLHTSGRHKGLSYNVVFQLLNAADYGVPQCRERVFIVGIRSDLQASFSFPTPTHTEDALLYSKWVAGDYWSRHRISKSKRPLPPAIKISRIRRLRASIPEMLGQPWTTVRDAIADLPKIASGQTSSQVKNHFLNPGARSYPGHTGSPYDEPAKTLKAGDHGVPGGENTLRFDDGSVRYFSVRECARIQTFPDDWEILGSWTESMRQLGNAVPVKLAEVVANRLREVIEANASDDIARNARRLVREVGR